MALYGKLSQGKPVEERLKRAEGSKTPDRRGGSGWEVEEGQVPLQLSKPSPFEVAVTAGLLRVGLALRA